MNENSGERSGAGKLPEGRLSRRNFLKLLAVSAVGLPAAAGLPPVEPREEAGGDELVADAIKQYLGLWPENAVLKNRFSNHVITAAALAEVEKLKATAVIGEIRAEDISPETFAAFEELKRSLKENNLKKFPNRQLIYYGNSLSLG